MARKSTFTPDDAEQLLRGRGPQRDDLRAVSDFIAAAASVTRVVPTEATAHRHLAAMAGAVGLEPETRFAPRSTTRVMAASILRSKIFRTLAGAVAAVVAMGGLAAAQTLPAPAQDAMAEVAERIGIDLPHSKEHEAKVKRGADHDGDGVADDNGLHTGQTGTKRGSDHDGDGIADDNGLHTGQNAEKTGSDHDGDGTADDNGRRKGENQGDAGENNDDDTDDRGRSDGAKHANPADRDDDAPFKKGRGSND